MKAVVVMMVLIAVSVLLVLLGLTAGINLNPQATVKFVPDWGSLGDWVSGVGALLAVVASFLIVQRNEKFQLARDSEQLVLNQEQDSAYLGIHLGCKGLRSCFVTDIRICSLKQRRTIKHDISKDFAEKFPFRLEPGEHIRLEWSGVEFKPLLHTIGSLQALVLEEFFIEVLTGISVHRFSLDPHTIYVLEEASRVFSISLVKQGDDLPF